MARSGAAVAGILLGITTLLPGACSGQAQCEAAGGHCVLGAAWCTHRGTQDCNPDLNPGGAFCCLSGLCVRPPVQASSYDQTCNVDDDCVAVTEGNPCVECAFTCTKNAAIRAGALPAYLADIADTPAVMDAGCAAICNASSDSGNEGPFCCGGRCQFRSPCGSGAKTDAGDAGVE